MSVCEDNFGFVTSVLKQGKHGIFVGVAFSLLRHPACNIAKVNNLAIKAAPLRGLVSDSNGMRPREL